MVVVWVDQASWLNLIIYLFSAIGCGYHIVGMVLVMGVGVFVVMVVVVGVVIAGGGDGCGWFVKFVVNVFIIIIMSSLYYFYQIAKNIDSLMLGGL